MTSAHNVATGSSHGRATALIRHVRGASRRSRWRSAPIRGPSQPHPAIWLQQSRNRLRNARSRSSDLRRIAVLVPVRDQHQQRLAYWFRNIAWLGTKTCGKRDFDAERRNAGFRPVTRFATSLGGMRPPSSTNDPETLITVRLVPLCEQLRRTARSNWQLERTSFRPCIERP